MLRPIVKQFRPRNGLNPPPGLPLRQTLMLKCGHLARRRPIANGGLHVSVHCEMCTMLAKERESKDEKRAAKKERKRVRRFRQQLKVEQLMAKKKMASSKVAKKKDLKKKGKPAKVKKEKGAKAGRKLVLVGKHLWAPKGSLLAKVLKAMSAADDQIMGENELVTAMEKAGVKAEGKKTVKKLVKGILRNLLRAGVVAKQREIKHNEELKAFIGDGGGDADDEDGEDGGDEDGGDEDGDEDGDESESEDEDGEDEDGDGEDEEKPKAKKKVVGKKKKK